MAKKQAKFKKIRATRWVALKKFIINTLESLLANFFYLHVAEFYWSRTSKDFNGNF